MEDVGLLPNQQELGLLRSRSGGRGAASTLTGALASSGPARGGQGEEKPPERGLLLRGVYAERTPGRKGALCRRWGFRGLCAVPWGLPFLGSDPLGWSAGPCLRTHGSGSGGSASSPHSGSLRPAARSWCSRASAPHGPPRVHTGSGFGQGCASLTKLGVRRVTWCRPGCGLRGDVRAVTLPTLTPRLSLLSHTDAPARFTTDGDVPRRAPHSPRRSDQRGVHTVTQTAARCRKGPDPSDPVSPSGTAPGTSSTRTTPRD